MDNASWWLDSGEAPGMLNWAIMGLARLRQKGRFTEPQVCREALEDYRAEVNPASIFLDECCRTEEGSQAITGDIYRAYKKWCDERGYRHLADAQFGKEIKRKFPNCEKKRGSGAAKRWWYYDGLVLLDDNWTT